MSELLKESSATPRTDTFAQALFYDAGGLSSYEKKLAEMAIRFACALERELAETQHSLSDERTRAARFETALREIAIYTGEGPSTTPWKAIVKDITDHARAALPEPPKEAK